MRICGNILVFPNIIPCSVARATLARQAHEARPWQVLEVASPADLFCV